MPTSKLLAKAFEVASKLPEKEQDNIAELAIFFIHPDEEKEAEWDTLVQSPQSQRFLDKMVKDLKEEETKEGLLPFPGDK